jgi:6-phosphofructokinase
MKRRLEARKIPRRFVARQLGYELRSTKPSCYDQTYARNLSIGALNGFLQGKKNQMVVWDGQSIGYEDLTTIMGEAGKFPVRTVNTSAHRYKRAKKFMDFITKEDLEDPVKLKKLAEVGNCTPEEIVDQFRHIVEE